MNNELYHGHDKLFRETWSDLSGKKTGLQYIGSLIKYVFSNVDDISVDSMQTIVSNALTGDKGDLIMSLADKIRKEGLGTRFIARFEELS